MIFESLLSDFRVVVEWKFTVIALKIEEKKTQKEDEDAA